MHLSRPWQKICDDCIAVVNRFDDCDVLNGHFGMHNVIIRTLPNEETKQIEYKPVFINFENCEVRGGDLSGED